MFVCIHSTPARPGDGRHPPEDLRRARRRARGRSPARRGDDAQAGRARPPLRRRQGGARRAGDPDRRRAPAPARALRRSDRVARRQLRDRPRREHGRGGHGRDRRAHRACLLPQRRERRLGRPEHPHRAGCLPRHPRDLAHAFGSDELAGRTVLVQGAGSVGAKLAAPARSTRARPCSSATSTRSARGHRRRARPGRRRSRARVRRLRALRARRDAQRRVDPAAALPHRRGRRRTTSSRRRRTASGCARPGSSTRPTT